MKNQSTANTAVSCKWTATLFLAFCFLLYAQDSKSKSNQNVDTEINAEMTSERKVIGSEDNAIKIR